MLSECKDSLVTDNIRLAINSRKCCNFQDDWNALQFASSIGDAEVAKTLISDGANPDFRTKVGVSLVHCKIP